MIPKAIVVITSKQTSYFPLNIKSQVSLTESSFIQCKDLVEVIYLEAKSFVIQIKRKTKTLFGFCAELGNR